MPSPDRPAVPSGSTPAAKTSAAGRPLSIDSAALKGVSVTLQARLGEATLSVAELLGLRHGSVVSLEAKLNDVVELRLNDMIIARGEIVAVDDHFGVRITEVSETK